MDPQSCPLLVLGRRLPELSYSSLWADLSVGVGRAQGSTPPLESGVAASSFSALP